MTSASRSRRFALAAGIATSLTVSAVAVGGVTAQATPKPKAPAPSAITEYYHGKAFRNFSPTNWNGATNCAVDSATSVHCFDTPAQMSNYISGQLRPAARTAPKMPMGFDCSGYTKIWNGPNWTGRGLAFSDWGYAMNLNSYVTVPFNVRSWFSDGQRAYDSNDCNARIYSGNDATGQNILLPADAHSISINFNANSIELFRP